MAEHSNRTDLYQEHIINVRKSGIYKLNNKMLTLLIGVLLLIVSGAFGNLSICGGFGFNSKVNAASSGKSTASAKSASSTTNYTKEELEELDQDPLKYRNTVTYNYGSDGEGVVGGSSTVTTSASKTPFSTSTFKHAKKFKGYTVSNGIDVSEWQGNIDWRKAKNAGVEFAIIRVGYRTAGSGRLYTDPKYKKNIAGAIKAGIKVGVYVYSQATTEAEARAEANFLISRVGSYNISLPLVLDFEYLSNGQGRLWNAHLSRAAATKVCIAFCKQVSNAGYEPMVYANPNFFSSVLYGDQIAEYGQIWLANFGLNNGKMKGYSAIYYGPYTYWQYTSTGHVAGIAGNVDCNFWYQNSQTITKAKKVAKSINITDEYKTMKTGTEQYLYYSLTPSGVTDDTKWTSSNNSVAYVINGTVYAVSAGETVITATTTTGATDICRITVSENMTNYTISDIGSETYTGSEIQPAVTVKSKKKTTGSGKAKKLVELYSYPDESANVVTTVAKGDKLTIQATEGSYYSVSYVKNNKTYYGYINQYYVKATLAKKTLVNGKDYTIKYTENTDSGTALCEVTGKGKGTYSGIASQVFTVSKANISKCRISKISDQVATSGTISPKVTVTYNGKTLVQGTDYKVSYSGNTATTSNVLGVNPLTAKATITGIGNFTGSTSISYNIGAADVSIADIADMTYTGNALTPAVTVKDAAGNVITEDIVSGDASGNAVVIGHNYTASYSDNTNAGSGLVKVTVNGRTYNKYFNINERDISEAYGSFSATYNYNAKAKSPSPTVKYNGVKLTKGTDYTLQYEDNTCAGTGTAYVVGTGNYKGTLELSFSILAKSITSATVQKVLSQSYKGGGQIKPALNISDGNNKLISGVDYEVTYSSNTKVGTAKAVIKGIGNYSGSRTVKFSIVKKNVNEIKVPTISALRYTGKQLKPAVKLRNNGTLLKAGRDYTISYGSNKARGKGSITIRGKGSYKGKRVIYFRIR